MTYGNVLSILYPMAAMCGIPPDNIDVYFYNGEYDGFSVETPQHLKKIMCENMIDNLVDDMQEAIDNKEAEELE